MKKLRLYKILIPLLFLSAANPSIAQFDFKPDTTAIYNGFMFQQVDSIFQLRKNNDFELRFQIMAHIKGFMKLAVISSKNGNWQAQWFEMAFSDSGFTWIEKRSPKDPEALWKKLKKNKILTLPGNEDIKDPTGEPLHIPILDGAYYNFQLINKNGYRLYGYHCPKTYVEDFPEIEAYKLVVENIRLIYDFFGEKSGVLCFNNKAQNCFDLARLN